MRVISYYYLYDPFKGITLKIAAIHIFKLRSKDVKAIMVYHFPTFRVHFGNNIFFFIN